MNAAHALILHFIEGHCNITLHLCVGLPDALFPTWFLTISHIHFLYVSYVQYPAHLVLNLTIFITLGEEYKLFTMQIYPSSATPSICLQFFWCHFLNFMDIIQTTMITKMNIYIQCVHGVVQAQALLPSIECL
jgi:hypothetical protein